MPATGVYHGGFGMANLYKGGVIVGTETPDINSTAAGTNGQILIGADSGAAPKFASLTSMDGSITFTPGPNSLDLSASGGTPVPPGGYTWIVVSTSTSSMANGTGYLANRSAGVTFTLPGTATVGSVYRIVGINTGGWTLNVGGGQVIQWGNITASSSLTSTTIGDAVEIVCSLANTDFVVISCQGNIGYL